MMTHTSFPQGEEKRVFSNGNISIVKSKDMLKLKKIIMDLKMSAILTVMKTKMKRRRKRTIYSKKTK
jgi:hypothetical protein